MIEVGNQILGVLAAHAYPDQAGANSEGIALGRCVAGMGHGGGVGNERLHATQTLSQRAEPDRPQATLGRLPAAQIEGDQSTEAGGLALVNGVARMVRKARPIDPLDLLLGAEEGSSLSAVLLVAG